ncbi:hypothetical protein DFH29DRAFT_927554 [Suillus ampliporus]|nr:hypothetical protein DFH29DRAFT_927554 [Suillus ampliporus]
MRMSFLGPYHLYLLQSPSLVLAHSKPARQISFRPIAHSNWSPLPHQDSKRPKPTSRSYLQPKARAARVSVNDVVLSVHHSLSVTLSKIKDL